MAPLLSAPRRSVTMSQGFFIKLQTRHHSDSDPRPFPIQPVRMLNAFPPLGSASLPPSPHGALYVVGGSSCLLFPDPRKHNYQGWCGIAATQPFFMSFAPSARDSHRGVVSPIFQRAANHHIPRQDPPISPTVHISINFIIQLFASNLKSRMLLSLKPPPFVPPSPAPAPP